jgi:hypothetical protein
MKIGSAWLQPQLLRRQGGLSHRDGDEVQSYLERTYSNRK